MTSRVKVTGSPSGVQTPWSELKNGQFLTGPYSATTSVDFYQHVGQNTKDFHRRKREGELLPFTSWFQESITGKVKDAAISVLDSSSNEFTFAGHRPHGKGRWMLTSNDLDKYATELNLQELAHSYVTEAAAAIYGQGFDALTFIGELHKTTRMFRNLINSLKNAGKTNSVSGIWNNRNLYDLWLEGRYGWRILMYELIELSEVINNISEGKIRERYKQRNGTKGEETETFTYSWTGGYGTYTTHYQDIIEWSVRGNILADVKPPQFAFNPITTAWELIPYSFVVDWIVNVGSWLESMSFLTIASNYEAAAGYKMKVTRKTTLVDLEPKVGWSLQSITQDTVSEASRVMRVPSSVSSSPSILPKFDPLKGFDLLALIRQQIRR